MRAPTADIAAPPFPGNLRWFNVASLRMDKQRGRPVLVEFWDFCRVNSLRTLPYLRLWHERYAADGLRVIGVHTGAFAVSRDVDAIGTAVERLEIPYPVVADSELQIWDLYGNKGWPARYLWDQRGALYSLHYGEGAYEETEREIQGLLGVERDPVPPQRPEDTPGLLLPAQTEDQPGAYSGPYEAGGVWAVLAGSGTVTANGRREIAEGDLDEADEVRRRVAVDGPGCYPLVEHPRHTVGTLEIEVGPGVECLATCFVPGVPAE